LIVGRSAAGVLAAAQAAVKTTMHGPGGLQTAQQDGFFGTRSPGGSMVRHVWMLSALLLPFAAEPYHAACLAFDSVNKVVYLSDPLEKECAGPVASCRNEIVAKWTAFLRKEGFAQTPGATVRCEMYNVGSTPDETPRSRVRKWRDEEAAQAQRGPVKYTKIVNTLFELNEPAASRDSTVPLRDRTSPVFGRSASVLHAARRTPPKAVRYPSTFDHGHAVGCKASQDECLCASEYLAPRRWTDAWRKGEQQGARRRTTIRSEKVEAG
jgi:hypothetical protein